MGGLIWVPGHPLATTDTVISAEMVTSVIESEEELSLLDSRKKNVADFLYTSCYCEENVYHLCKTLREQGLAANDTSDLFIVFISNPIKQIPMWQQRKSTQADGLCVWDYHVICIQTALNSGETKVWDLDTSLPLPVTLSKYVCGALRPDVPVNRKYNRFFRVIKASLYLRFFASDRRHMKDGKGTWLASPPSYDCIVAEDGEVHNLDKYNIMEEEQMSHHTDMAFNRLEEDKFGVVLSEGGMLDLFSGRIQTITVSNQVPLC